MDNINSNKNQNDKSADTKPKQKPLFTQEQIAEQIRNFIYAYQHGLVKLKPIEKRVPYDNPAMELIYLGSLKTDARDKGESTETRLRKGIINQISICAGTTQATDEERYEKMLEFFDVISALRTFDRLIGESASYDVSQKLDLIDKRLIETENKISGILSRFDLFGH